jgi:hypothetical protein
MKERKMRSSLKSMAAASILLLGQMTFASAATMVLPSTPETVYKGPLSPNVPAVLHIKSGDTVTINTVNGRGGKDAAAFFAKAGVPAKDILKDEDTINNMPTKDYGFAHPRRQDHDRPNLY